jgi:acyl-CoA thioesterase-1
MLAACQNETMNTSATDTVPSATRTKRIVFFGNSLVAGYGLTSRSESFVGRIAERIDSLDLNYEVINAGVSGETTAGGLRRIDSVLQKPIDIFVLELGANDVFRGFSPDTTKNNLQRIINRVRTASPDVQIIVAGMKPPIYTGNAYIDRFGAIYEEVATENEVLLVPFLLQGVALVASLNQVDRIHPNAAGHRVMTETVWEVLKTAL